MSTVAIELLNGQLRDPTTRHAQTMAIPVVHPTGPSSRELFVAAYDRFASRCRDVDEPGLAVVAIDEHSGACTGVVRIRARVARHVVALVGRHSRCDLFLDTRADLALRHLAIVIDPVRAFDAGSRVDYRVLDLRTDSGFTDETGRNLRGVRADGPAILRCAGHVLFALPLGDPTDWPACGVDAWDMLPERVYFDEAPGREELRSMQRRSSLFCMHGPRDTSMHLAEHGVVGWLDVHGVRQRGTIPVGDEALRAGILFGRYTRCDGAGLADDISLSRVHMLLLQIDNTLLAIDTASTHGVRLLGSADERIFPVADNAQLRLGNGTFLRWRRKA